MGRIPSRCSRVERIQNNVSFGVEMMLNKLALWVVKGDLVSFIVAGLNRSSVVYEIQAPTST